MIVRASILVLSLVFIVSAMAQDKLSVAKSALRDGLWDIARSHALADGSDEARLVVLESYVGEGRWDEIAKLLNGDWKSASGYAFDYYRAVIAGDHASAVKILSKVGSESGLMQARLYEANCLAAAGDRVGATKLWREIAANTNAGERAFATASVNSGDVELMRKAYATVKPVGLRRMIGLRLGRELLGTESSRDEGERLIQSIVADSPDAEGAKDAFLALADTYVKSARWKQSLDAYRKATEIWPDTAKRDFVNDGVAISLWRLGRREEALQAFVRAEELASSEEAKAVAIVRQGDVLADLGRIAESTDKYRKVLSTMGGTVVAKTLKSVVETRELESVGREHYRNFRFKDALESFAKVAVADPRRAKRMELFRMYCLYGLGQDDEAAKLADRLSSEKDDEQVRLDAILWLAKLNFNRRDWKGASAKFQAYANDIADEAAAADAMVWAAKAEFMGSNHAEAIRITTKLLECYPSSAAKPKALLVQAETLVEQSRYDEALMVVDRAIASDVISQLDRQRATLLKADVLYALGADNPRCYNAALETYNTLRFAGAQSESSEIVLAFKVARTLEKLRRREEAIDLYYSKVVLPYRAGRERRVHYDEDAMAVFSRAAFRLADEYESSGKDVQAIDVLELLSESDVPASAEAARRIKRISSKGLFL